jgi:hypothetical protein
MDELDSPFVDRSSTVTSWPAELAEKIRDRDDELDRGEVTEWIVDLEEEVREAPGRRSTAGPASSRTAGRRPAALLE